MARCFFVFGAVVASLLASNAFYISLSSRNHLATRSGRIPEVNVKRRTLSASSLSMVVEIEQEEKRPLITVGEYFTPPYIDRTNLRLVLTGQAILTGVAFLAGWIVHTDILKPELSFDFESMKFAFIFGAGMLSKHLTIKT